MVSQVVRWPCPHGFLSLHVFPIYSDFLREFLRFSVGTFLPLWGCRSKLALSHESPPICVRLSEASSFCSSPAVSLMPGESIFGFRFESMIVCFHLCRVFGPWWYIIHLLARQNKGILIFYLEMFFLVLSNPTAFRGLLGLIFCVLLVLFLMTLFSFSFMWTSLRLRHQPLPGFPALPPLPCPGHEGSLCTFYMNAFNRSGLMELWYHEPLLGTFPCSDRRLW